MELRDWVGEGFFVLKVRWEYQSILTQKDHLSHMPNYVQTFHVASFVGPAL